MSVFGSVIGIDWPRWFLAPKLRLVVRQVKAHLDLGFILRILLRVIEGPEALLSELECVLGFLPLLCRGVNRNWRVMTGVIVDLIVLEAEKAC